MRLGGYALSRRGPLWTRLLARTLFFAPIPVGAFAAFTVDPITPYGVWMGLYFYSFLLVLAFGCAIPHQPANPDPQPTTVPGVPGAMSAPAPTARTAATFRFPDHLITKESTMVAPHQPGSSTQRRKLARITAVAGLTTLILVLGSSLANNYQSAAFTSSAEQTVAFFQSLNDWLGALSSFLTSIGLIAMLWFTIGLALVLRRYDGEAPWRSAFLAGAGVVSVATGQIASWDAAAFRAGDITPEVARYAFDLGNLSFANGWVATGAVAICAGMIIISARELPTWLGWWAIIAGIGQVLARAIWTQDIAMLPFAAFWAWTAVVSVLLIRGRLDKAETDAPAPHRSASTA